MDNATPKVGRYVHLQNTASYYGKITKINKLTFAVEHNLAGRDLFLLEKKGMRYSTKDDIFHCTVIEPNTSMEKTAIEYME